ncbi:MAG: GGDEF domain-containing protein [Gallionella sp.]
MEYSHDRKESEEILRMIIQRMAAHPAAFTPHTYAVWYEFLIGTNPALSTEMDRLLENNVQLSDVAIEQLYENHVSEFKQDLNRILREDMKQMLNNLINITAETKVHAEAFENNLQSYGNQLLTKPGLAILDELITKMTSDTKSMRGSMTNLHSELVQSKEEVGNLQIALESARKEALIDPLTNIYNRRGYEMQVQMMFDNTDLMQKGACMLFVDIDHFKKINDTYGHVFGDKVLRIIANTLKSMVKGQDCVARIGGEEFAILLPGTELNGARAVAENIRASIENGKIRHGKSSETISRITVSIGMAAYTNGSTLTEWMDIADKALYISKKNGRNQVTVYAAELAC